MLARLLSVGRGSENLHITEYGCLFCRTGSVLVIQPFVLRECVCAWHVCACVCLFVREPALQVTAVAVFRLFSGNFLETPPTSLWTETRLAGN